MTESSNKIQLLAEKEIMIAAVVDQFRVAINAGSIHGVQLGQRFQIYKIGNEIIDPITKEHLGRLEIVKGIGEVIHVQDRIATLQTTDKHEVRRSSGWIAAIGAIEVTKEPKAFIDPEVGDRARLINK